MDKITYKLAQKVDPKKRKLTQNGNSWIVVEPSLKPVPVATFISEKKDMDEEKKGTVMDLVTYVVG
eukprot:400850-Amorphochlora_amoeboformis.AAC.1